MRSGDIAKSLVIILTLSFTVCMIGHELGIIDFFSKSYRERGFCICYSDKSPLIQTHSITFYVDALMALFMFAIVKAGQKANMIEKSLRPIKKNAYSLFGHGCGHLLLAIGTKSDSSGIFENLTMRNRVLLYPIFLVVWYGFMSDSRRSFKVSISLAILHNTAQVFFMPTRLFFVHVLLAVLLSSALRGLAREPWEKDRYYDLEAILVDVPILLATFGEAITCDSFLVNYGGHVWFDMVVPIGYLVYYVILLADPEEHKEL